MVWYGFNSSSIEVSKLQRSRRDEGYESETLAHVLGSCPKGDLLRNTRHHKCRTMIADEFWQKEWDMFEEVTCIRNEDSSRRIDIIAIDRKNKVAHILDPTVRYEAGENQAVEVDE